MPRQFGIPEPLIHDVQSKAVPVSKYSDYMKSIQDKHIIGINNAYRLGPWLDVLFFGDCSWYLLHRKEIANWPGLKVSCCPRFSNERQTLEHIKFLQKDQHKKLGISTNRSTVVWNFNSGAASISLAIHFGVKKIYLLGFDMSEMGSQVHWHGPHRDRVKNTHAKPPFNRHLRGFPTIAKDAKSLGVEIYNVSPNSAIEEFPKITLEEALR